jgi:hypothetical protein
MEGGKLVLPEEGLKEEEEDEEEERVEGWLSTLLTVLFELAGFTEKEEVEVEVETAAEVGYEAAVAEDGVSANLIRVDDLDWFRNLSSTWLE